MTYNKNELIILVHGSENCPLKFRHATSRVANKKKRAQLSSLFFINYIENNLKALNIYFNKIYNFNGILYKYIKRKEEKMNKKALILALSIVMLTGCGNKKDETKSTESNKSSVESTEKVEDDNKSNTKEERKVIGGEEKGEGNITLSTPCGEGKDVTLIVDEETVMTSIGLNAESVGVDGNEPTIVYVDGDKNRTLQLAKDVQAQESLDLEEENLTEGKHIVEVIQEKDGEQTFYRQLSYTVKK